MLWVHKCFHPLVMGDPWLEDVGRPMACGCVSLHNQHDSVMTWNRFPHNRPFARGWSEAGVRGAGWSHMHSPRTAPAMRSLHVFSVVSLNNSQTKVMLPWHWRDVTVTCRRVKLPVNAAADVAIRIASWCTHDKSMPGWQHASSDIIYQNRVEIGSRTLLCHMHTGESSYRYVLSFLPIKCQCNWGRIYLNYHIEAEENWTLFLQKTLSNAFSWMKTFEFRLRFHWSLCRLTVFQQWLSPARR